MANYLTALNLTMGHEGALANNPNDNGKLTYKGIASAFWPNWQGWPYVRRALEKANNNINLANNYLGSDQTVQALVNQFYKINFWDIYSLDRLDDQAIANEIFDSAVNMGVSIEANFLQRALNMLNRNQKLYPDLKVDGAIGPKTIDTFNKHPNKKLVLKLLNVLQGARYVSIMENNTTQEEFATSWLSRVSL